MQNFAALGVGVGLIGIMTWSISVAAKSHTDGKLIDAQREAIAARAWDQLSIRAILKRADPDLKTWMLKSQEHALIVHEFQALANITIKTRDYTAMKLVMNRLRTSPCFSDTYRPEFDALWMMLSKTHGPIKCSALFSAFPEHTARFTTTFSCQQADDVVEMRDAIEALEVKLF